MRLDVPQIIWHSLGNGNVSERVNSVDFLRWKRPLTLATCGADEDIHIWEIKPTTKLYASDRESSGSGTKTPIRYEDGVIRHMATCKGHEGEVNIVRFHPKGELILASGSSDEAVCIWAKVEPNSDVVGTVTNESPPPNVSLSANFSSMGGYRVETMKSVQGAPEGHTELTGVDDTCSQLWKRRSFFRCFSPVYGICWSPDGSFIVAATEADRLIIIDVAAGRIIKHLEGHSNLVLGVVWDPCNQFIASQSSDQTIRLWAAPGYCSNRCLAGGNNVNNAAPWREYSVLRNVEESHILPSSLSPCKQKRRNLFLPEAAINSFYRRPDFLPDGSLLLAPCGAVPMLRLKHPTYKIEQTAIAERSQLQTTSAMSNETPKNPQKSPNTPNGNPPVLSPSSPSLAASKEASATNTASPLSVSSSTNKKRVTQNEKQNLIMPSSFAFVPTKNSNCPVAILPSPSSAISVVIRANPLPFALNDFLGHHLHNSRSETLSRSPADAPPNWDSNWLYSRSLGCPLYAPDTLQMCEEKTGKGIDIENADENVEDPQHNRNPKLVPRYIFASGDVSGGIAIWDTQQFHPLFEARNVHFQSITDIAWSDDARLMVVSSSDGYISILSFNPGELGKVLIPEIISSNCQTEVQRRSKRSQPCAAKSESKKGIAELLKPHTTDFLSPSIDCCMTEALTATTADKGPSTADNGPSTADNGPSTADNGPSTEPSETIEMYCNRKKRRRIHPTMVDSGIAV